MANKTKKKYKSKKERNQRLHEQKQVEATGDVLNPKKSIPAFPSYYYYLIFIVLGFVLYGNTITHDYALDDAIVISKNKFTQQGISGIPDIFKYDTFVGFWLTNEPEKSPQQIQEDKQLVAGGRYRPLSLVTFALELQFFSKEVRDHNNDFKYYGAPTVSHINNILLYILTTIILFKVLQRLLPYKNTGKPWFLSLPFIISLLFLAHPIHTEAVANIKGRDEIMTLLGSLLALWYAIKYLDTNKSVNLIWSSLFLFLGLLSKENAITFLALVPLSLYYFTNYNLQKVFKTTLPLLGVSALFLIIRAVVLDVGGTERQVAQELMNNPFLHATVGEKFATIFFTLWMYIRLLFYPHPLTYDYYPKQIEIIGWENPGAFLPLLLYLALGAYAVYGMVKKKDVFSYSIWFYLIPLSVVSNIFFPVGTFMNERFVFISSIGFCIFAGYLIHQYIPKLVKNTEMSNNITIVILLVILSLYSVKTISRNRAWENDYILFTTDVKTSYNSAKSTCSAGGKILEKAQRPPISENQELHDSLVNKAINYLERSLYIYEDYIDAFILLGNAHFQLDRNIANTLRYKNEVLKRRPFHRVALNNTRIVLNNAHVLLSSGRSTATPEEILEEVNKLMELKPDHAKAHHIAGYIHARFIGDLGTAMDYLNKADELGLKTYRFYRDFAITHGSLRNHDEALKWFLKTLELKKDDPVTYLNTAVTYMQIGNRENLEENYEKALELLYEAAELDPDNPQIFQNIALGYSVLGDTAQTNKYVEIFTEMTAETE